MVREKLWILSTCLILLVIFPCITTGQNVPYFPLTYYPSEPQNGDVVEVYVSNYNDLAKFAKFQWVNDGEVYRETEKIFTSTSISDSFEVFPGNWVVYVYVYDKTNPPKLINSSSIQFEVPGLVTTHTPTPVQTQTPTPTPTSSSGGFSGGGGGGSVKETTPAPEPSTTATPTPVPTPDLETTPVATPITPAPTPTKTESPVPAPSPTPSDGKTEEKPIPTQTQTDNIVEPPQKTEEKKEIPGFEAFYVLFAFLISVGVYYRFWRA